MNLTLTGTDDAKNDLTTGNSIIDCGAANYKVAVVQEWMPLIADYGNKRRLFPFY